MPKPFLFYYTVAVLCGSFYLPLYLSTTNQAQILLEAFAFFLQVCTSNLQSCKGTRTGARQSLSPGGQPAQTQQKIAITFHQACS